MLWRIAASLLVGRFFGDLMAAGRNQTGRSALLADYIPDDDRNVSFVRHRAFDRRDRYPNASKEEETSLSCFGFVSCFHSAEKRYRSRMKAIPLEVMETRFFLFTRSNPQEGQIIPYDDRVALERSNFDPKRPTKFIIHGWRASITDPRPMFNKNAFLKQGDVNVVLVDWGRASAAYSYFLGVVYTHLVANQVATLIQIMIKFGSSPKQFHLVGSSMGAQMAGFVGEALISNGYKLGQITGLDPSSPFFQGFAIPKGIGLDKTDADFVEVIHSNGGSIVTGHYGVGGRLGHVDYYPNGGQNQPGCKDPLTIWGAVHNIYYDTEAICSHKRAWDMYIESITSECRFVGFPCNNLRDFDRDFVFGKCFSCWNQFCGKIGHRSKHFSERGPLYLVTRSSSPFCGDQLRATIDISDRTTTTKGEIHLQLEANGTTVNFDMSKEVDSIVEGGKMISRVIAVKFGTLKAAEIMQFLEGTISFVPHSSVSHLGSQHIYLNTVAITDQNGKGWYFCGSDTFLEDKGNSASNNITISLQPSPC